MMERTMPQRDLTDDQYKTLMPLLPPVKPVRGRTNLDHRDIINGILWVQRTGAPWRDVPPHYGKWGTIYSRWYRWSHDGVWDQVLLALQHQAEAHSLIDWWLHHVDSTSVRVHVDGAGAPLHGATPEMSAQLQGLGRSRGGLTSKVHIRVDGTGKVMTICVGPGQRHDSLYLEALMEQEPLHGGRRGRPRSKPRKLVADKGYSSRKIRQHLRSRGIGVVIPRKSNENWRGFFDKPAYRQRNIVERTIGHLKRWRRLATRYDKLERTFKSFWTLAIILQWLDY
jgi:transposase